MGRSWNDVGSYAAYIYGSNNSRVDVYGYNVTNQTSQQVIYVRKGMRIQIVTAGSTQYYKPLE